MTRTLILCYHGFSSDNSFSVTPEMFESQMHDLLSYATCISLEETVLSPKDTDKPYRVCITIDDGFQDVLLIRDVIKKYRIPVTLFVLSDPQHAHREEVGQTQQFLTPDQIQSLVQEGWEIGCHSATHPDFSSLDTEQKKNEITQAKHDLEKKIGKNIRYFAYPKGKCPPSVITVAQKSGYDLSCATLPGFCTPQTHRHAVPRTVVRNYHTLHDIRTMFSTSWHIKEKIKNALRYYVPSYFSSAPSRPSMLTLVRHTFYRPYIPDLPETQDMPTHIAGYTKKEQLIKKNQRSKFTMGLYTKDGKTYFLKQWTGKKKDTYYYELTREYLNARAFWTLLQKHPDIDISTPEPIICISTGTSLTLVMEHIPGTPLPSLPMQEQIRWMSHVLRSLHTLSASSNISQIDLPKRTHWYYLCSFPVIVLFALIHRCIPMKLIWKAVWAALIAFPSLRSRQMSITHRDLICDNVMIYQDRVYVVDCAFMNISPDGYDISYFAIDGSSQEVSTQVQTQLGIVQDPFFLSYICLQNGNYTDPITKKNHYKAMLTRLYETNI